MGSGLYSLHLQSETRYLSKFWDIGAGNISVSIESPLFHTPYGLIAQAVLSLHRIIVSPNSKL
jgi:hypothetical protein